MYCNEKKIHIVYVLVGRHLLYTRGCYLKTSNSKQSNKYCTIYEQAYSNPDDMKRN
jgi:hypothetical protein